MTALEADVSTNVDTEPYLIVSTDSHAGPRIKEQLREYCPKKHLEAFDAFVAAWEPHKMGPFDDGSFLAGGEGGMPFTDKVKHRTDACNDTTGLWEPTQRLADMDSQGVAAELIFHGVQDDQALLPFMGMGDLEMEAVGIEMYNRWLADFIKADPERFIGAIQLPMWDIEASIAEVRWAAENGIKAINFPAPTRDLPAFNEPVYEPFWQVIDEIGIPLTTHGGGGDTPTYTGKEAWALYMSDLFFYSRRGLWYLTWSGVFERYPNLQLVFVEQRADWVKQTLAHLDSIYSSEWHEWEQMIPKAPSEYFQQNCWVGSSFMARYEVEMRHDVGVDRLMWGTDYPHYEGTWPYTDKVLRQSFAGFPVEDVRKILGENAVKCFHLDDTYLREVAKRIGPTPEAVNVPLGADELPDSVGCSFRTISTWG